MLLLILMCSFYFLDFFICAKCMPIQHQLHVRSSATNIAIITCTAAFFLCIKMMVISWLPLFLNCFQIAMWFVLWWKPIPIVFILSKMFFAGFASLHNRWFVAILSSSSWWLLIQLSFKQISAGVSLFAALGFLLYGGR